MENLDLYLSDDEYVIPDIMLICDRNQVRNDKYRGVPRFVAETLSPATSLKDKTIKKDIYAKLGIDEYWILSPGEKSVEVLKAMPAVSIVLKEIFENIPSFFSICLSLRIVAQAAVVSMFPVMVADAPARRQNTSGCGPHLHRVPEDHRSGTYADHPAG